jgi:arylsulfatase A-like enzyme
VTRAPSRHGTLLAQRLAAGVAAGALAHAATVLVLTAAGVPIDQALGASHGLVVSAFQVAAALLLGGWWRDRLWAAAAFAFPCAAGLRRLGMVWLGAKGELGVFVAAGLLAVAWASAGRRRGAPWPAAVCGALAGMALARVHIYAPVAHAIEPRALAVVGALVALLLGVALVASRVPALARIPSMRASAAAAAGAWAAAVATAAVSQAVHGRPAVPPALAVGDAPPAVVIVLDTVRADHLDLYGYHRETMPALRRFAETSAVVVDRSISNGATSLTSHASLFTGLYPPRHGAHAASLGDTTAPGYAMRPDVPTLGEILGDAGYWSVAEIANFGALDEQWGLARGFDVYDASPSKLYRMRSWSPWADLASSHPDYELGRIRLEALPPFSTSEFFTGSPYRRAAVITDRAIEVVEAAGTRPFFLFVNYFDAHEPLFPPAAWRDRFPGRDSSLGRMYIHDRKSVIRDKQPLGDDQYAHLTSLYDGELSYLDSQLARLLDALRRHPRWDETLVVITADHGEAFGEHSHLGHSLSLYGEQTWVPLVVKLPDVEDAGAEPRLDGGGGMFQTVDVFASVLSHAGVAPPAGIDGVAWGRGRESSYSWLWVFYNHVRRFGAEFDRELRAVESRRWKLIQSTQGPVEVYDLRDDPSERRPSDAIPGERRAALSRSLVTHGATEQPGENKTLSPQMLQNLRDLGYVE